jgi:hypothetical protein
MFDDDDEEPDDGQLVTDFQVTPNPEDDDFGSPDEDIDDDEKEETP